VTDTGHAGSQAPGPASSPGPRPAPSRGPIPSSSPPSSPAPGRARPRDDVETVTGWTAWVVFAGVMMMMMGGFHAFIGLIALFEDEYFVTTSSGLAVNVDYTQWGWTHLILGAVVFVAGFAVMGGHLWARVVGVVLAVLSAFTNMVFIAAYPLWSVIIITIDVLTIYALIVHGRETRSMTGLGDR
jgi:hypothetical protein